MKDYSNFIKSSFGFVTGYDIENGEVLVHTPHTKRDEPQKYSTNSANYFDSRIGEQYKMIIEHQDEIIEYNRKRATKIIIPTYVVLGVITAVLFFAYGSGLIIGTGLGVFLLTGVSFASAMKNSEEKFKENLRQYDKYIRNRQKIEEIEKCDPNITSYLNETTLSFIEENKQLKQQGIIDSIFNINLMDKMSLKELKILLLRYKISEGLYQEQTFHIPSLEESHEQYSGKPKKKELVPSKNDRQNN